MTELPSSSSEAPSPGETNQSTETPSPAESAGAPQSIDSAAEKNPSFESLEHLSQLSSAQREVVLDLARKAVYAQPESKILVSNPIQEMLKSIDRRVDEMLMYNGQRNPQLMTGLVLSVLLNRIESWNVPGVNVVELYAKIKQEFFLNLDSPDHSDQPNNQVDPDHAGNPDNLNILTFFDAIASMKPDGVLSMLTQLGLSPLTGVGHFGQQSALNLRARRAREARIARSHPDQPFNPIRKASADN